MTRKLLTALVLIALTVLVLVLNARGPSVKLDIGFADFALSRAIAFFCFTTVGVVIGVLLK